MNNHTPGPWIVGRINPDTIYGGTQQFTLAELDGIYPEKNANARLIAAAPELRDALELLERFVSHHHGENADWTLCIDAARAALAKVVQS